MTKSKRKRTPKAVLKLPDLEQSKSAVLNSLTSPSSQRSYDHAIREFIEWYCSEPRLAFNKTVVTRYRISLEQRNYASSTINLHLAAVRRGQDPHGHSCRRHSRDDPPLLPVEVFRLIEKERVQGCCLVPTMATALINSSDRKKYDLSSLRRIMIGGAASAPTLVREVEEKLACTCFSGHGLTETSPVLTVSPLKTGIQCEGSQRYVRQAMTGFGIPGVELRVVDQEGTDIPPNGKTVGQILARGDGVMEGYLRQPEETNHAFQGGWFHTGDMATVDENRYLLIVDREKDIIVSGGENISSLELEKALAAHPSVYEVAVIPVPDEKWGEVPTALVVVKPDSKATETELLEFCRSGLAHYKCPSSVEFLERLPKTGTGKILKETCARNIARRSKQRDRKS